MLNNLSDGVTINKKTGTKEISQKVFEEQANALVEKKKSEDKDVFALTQQIKGITDCLDKGMTEFIIDYPGTGMSEMIHFTIIITPNTAGGRRSKTRRAKKGKRKETKRRRRGHRRF